MVAVVEALLLTVLILSAAAVNVGRHNVPSPSQTLQVRDEVEYWPVEPTPPPNPRFAAMALKRQNGGPTCGYYEYNSEPYGCYTNQACVTRSGYFGCTSGSQPYTACLDAFDSKCAGSTQGIGTLCCTFSTDYPLCVTAIKSVTDDFYVAITGFACGNNHAKGSKLLLETNGQTTSVRTTKSTSASALDSSATTATASTVDNIPAETTTTAPSPAPSGTPVGAIVGGVIGGLTVIGLTVLGIVWVLLRSRREKSGASAAAPSVMNHSYTYSAMPHNGAPSEPRSPPSQSMYGVNSHKGYYHQSDAGSPRVESFYHSAPTVSIFTPMASEAPYQPTAAPLSSVPENGRRLSETPVINPPGTGNNATELPSERYDRD